MRDGHRGPSAAAPPMPTTETPVSAVTSFAASFSKLRPKSGDIIVIQVPKDTPGEDIEKLFAAVSPIPNGCKVIAINETMSITTLTPEVLDAMGLMWKPTAAEKIAEEPA